MEKKENVYGKNDGTEKVMQEKAAAGEQVGAPQEVSTVAGKFKDVSALVRAYESLQAEFTRRSQRLKELEKLAENPKKLGEAEDSGAEKLRKNAESRRERTKAFDEFVLDVGRAHEQLGPNEKGENAVATATETVDENAKITATEQVRVETTGKEGDLQVEENALGVDKTTRPSVAGNAPSEDLYTQVCRNEGVRLRIIGEYLSSVGKSAPPITAAGVGTLVSPPRKAKNIGDAAAMALQYFKNA